MENKPTAFCIECGCMVPYSLAIGREMVTVREKTFCYNEITAHCLNCGNILYVPEINDKNARARQERFFKCDVHALESRFAACKPTAFDENDSDRTSEQDVKAASSVIQKAHSAFAGAAQESGLQSEEDVQALVDEVRHERILRATVHTIQKPTDVQVHEIELAAVKPIVPDEDAPELTPEQYAEKATFAKRRKHQTEKEGPRGK